MVIQAADKNLDLDDISDTLSGMNTVTSALYDYYTIHKDMDELRDEINSSMMSTEEKDTATAKINDLENDKKWFMIATTALPLIAGAAAGGAPALLFSALLGSITATSDYFWDHRVGLIKGCEPIDNAFSESNDHGAGWIALTNDSVDEGSTSVITINERGNYFFAADVSKTIYIGQSTGGPPVNATLCLHGHDAGIGSIYIRGGSTLTIQDCKFKMSEAGEKTAGGAANGVRVNNGCKLILKNGEIALFYASSRLLALDNQGGEVTIENGIINGVIEITEGGKITVNNGMIPNGMIVKNGGEVIINGGKVQGGNYAIDSENSKVTITGGQIEGAPWLANNKNGTLDISGGVHKGEIGNDSGSITITDGEIEGTVRNTSGTININGGTIADYDWGVLNQSEGTVNVTGGTIAGSNGRGTAIENNGGRVNISGGKVGDETCTGVINKTNGIVVISGGEIPGSLSNNSGNVTITGGTIKGNLSGAISNASGGEITISGGTIIGNSGIMNHGTGKVNLVIDQNSDILIDGGSSKAFWLASGASRIPTSVAADTNYFGGVTYYSSANAQGTPMTIAEATGIDYTQPYVRLVANGAVSGGNITVTPPQAVMWPTPRAILRMATP